MYPILLHFVFFIALLNRSLSKSNCVVSRRWFFSFSHFDGNLKCYITHIEKCDCCFFFFLWGGAVAISNFSSSVRRALSQDWEYIRMWLNNGKEDSTYATPTILLSLGSNLIFFESIHIYCTSLCLTASFTANSSLSLSHLAHQKLESEEELRKILHKKI